ncbi:MAG: CARDB domain-containing protein [Chitinophagaceae bacterium]
MKKLFVLLCLFFGMTQINAQTPKVPTGTPGKLPLPNVNPNPLVPADLVITNLTFVSIVFNVEAKTYVVKVIATIRNNGGVQSNKTQLQAYTKTPAGSGSWKIMGGKVNMPVLDPNKTYSSVYSFKGSVVEIGSVLFDFRLRVDPSGLVTESNVSNNYSDILVINPRAH